MNHLAEPQNTPHSVSIILKSLGKKKRKGNHIPLRHWGSLLVWTLDLMQAPAQVDGFKARKQGGGGSNWRPLGPSVPSHSLDSIRNYGASGSAHNTTNPRALKGWCTLWAGRAFKRPLVSSAPGVGVPSPSLLLHGHTSHILQHSEDGVLIGNSISRSY